MDAIRTYLDNVFAAFPQTQRVLTLKNEMLNNMEEKYQELKRQGKSEHEAVGGVIADFGSIQEIAAELGVEQQAAEPEGLWVSREDAQTYLSTAKKCGIWIGAGVWLILAGLAAMSVPGTPKGAAGMLLFFTVIAAAVVIFILNGMRLSRYESYTKENVLLDAQTRAEVEEKNARFMPRFPLYIAAGVALIILSFGVAAFLSQSGRLGSDERAGALLLFTVGFGVFVLIQAGMTKSAFDALLGKGDYKNKSTSPKAERLIGTVASVFWPVMVASYLLWSFISDAWHISWVIWPVAGILFGAFAAGVSTWMGTNVK